jgi:uncharacterized protein (TIGR00661 family)
MKERIYVSVCGEGLGHSSRAIAVTEELIARGYEVILGSYGYAYDYLKSQKLCRVTRVPEELIMRGESGVFSVEKTFFSTLKTVLIRTESIVSEEKKLMEKHKVSCVISDGRISPIVAASYHLGLPVLYVTNITSIRKTFLKRFVDHLLLKRPLDFVTKSASILADEIIIPDFPPPPTICYYLLSRNNRIKKKITFSGPVVRRELYESKPIKTKKPTVLSLIGGHEFRKPLIDCVAKAAELNKDINFIIVSRLIRKPKKKENLELLPFVNNVYSYIKASDFIISQSGHSTMMEMICSGKTGIVIPDKNQYEQEAIARRVKEMKLYKTMSYETEETHKELTSFNRR